MLLSEIQMMIDDCKGLETGQYSKLFPLRHLKVLIPTA